MQRRRQKTRERERERERERSVEVRGKKSLKGLLKVGILCRRR